MTKFDLNKQSTSTLLEHFKYITSDILTSNVSSLFFVREIIEYWNFNFDLNEK